MKNITTSFFRLKKIACLASKTLKSEAVQSQQMPVLYYINMVIVLLLHQ